jgi:polyhydroxyalkanoate synthesis regulator protein
MATSEHSVLIKQYGGGRLYRPGTGSYMTLDDLAVMVEDEENFVVCEARTGEDITATILRRIILQRATHG